ncbi:MAG TPA: hypothetical protein VGG64_23930 [Pirellulales bacterium]
MGTVEVVMLETSGLAVDGLKAFYQSVFKGLGYERVAIHVLSAMPKAQKDVFEERVVDVFISDLTLGKQDIADGLTLLHAVKEAYPDVLLIANSKTNVASRKVAAQAPCFDLFVDKTRMTDEQYTAHVGREVARCFRRNPCAEIAFDASTLGDEFKHKKHRIALTSIIRAITFCSHTGDKSTSIHRVVLKPLAGGKSQSQVYDMQSYTRDELACVRTVLKVGQPEEIAREIDNYASFVKWYFPYTWRPELIGCSFTKRWGAVCYSLAHGGDQASRPLGDVVAAGHFDTLNSAVRLIFSSDSKQWYHQRNVELSNDNLVKYYTTRWTDKSKEDLEERFRKQVPEASFVAGERFHLFGTSCPAPSSYLFGVPRLGFHTCIRHGDLNLRNVIVCTQIEMEDADEGKYAGNGDMDARGREGLAEVFFIDFEQTGRGHVYEDFVMFETSVRLWYQGKDDFEALVAGEIALARGQESTLPYASTVQNIRTLARENFGTVETSARYAYAAAMCAYGMLRFKTLEPWQERQVAACLVGNLCWLEEEEGEKARHGV